MPEPTSGRRAFSECRLPAADCPIKELIMAKRVIKYDPQATFNGIAGEAIAEGDLCGIADTNGNVFKADADATQGAAATNKAVGFAVKAAAIGAMVALAPICTLDGLTSQ